jgi:predicted DNA-binding transcriptional regulator AlpA
LAIRQTEAKLEQGKSKKKKSTPAKQVTAARQATKLPAALLSRHEVVALSGFTYPWLWQMMRRGQFPRSRVVGGKSMWLSTEVETWLAALPVRQLKGDSSNDLQNGVNTPGISRLLADIATAPDEAYIVDLVTNNLETAAALPPHQREQVNEQIADTIREWREARAS